MKKQVEIEMCLYERRKEQERYACINERSCEPFFLPIYISLIHWTHVFRGTLFNLQIRRHKQQRTRRKNGLDQ